MTGYLSCTDKKAFSFSFEQNFETNFVRGNRYSEKESTSFDKGSHSNHSSAAEVKKKKQILAYHEFQVSCKGSKVKIQRKWAKAH